MKMETHEIDDRVTRIRLGGRLDTKGADEIEREFSSAVLHLKHNTVVDMSGVDFVASMGIRMLLEAARGAKLRREQVVLFGVQPMVQVVFDRVGLGDLIRIVPDEAQALAVAREPS
jgi:anti-anti-sigma factor